MGMIRPPQMGSTTNALACLKLQNGAYGADRERERNMPLAERSAGGDAGLGERKELQYLFSALRRNW